MCAPHAHRVQTVVAPHAGSAGSRGRRGPRSRIVRRAASGIDRVGHRLRPDREERVDVRLHRSAGTPSRAGRPARRSATGPRPRIERRRVGSHRRAGLRPSGRGRSLARAARPPRSNPKPPTNAASSRVRLRSVPREGPDQKAQSHEHLLRRRRRRATRAGRPSSVRRFRIELGQRRGSRRRCRSCQNSSHRGWSGTPKRRRRPHGVLVVDGGERVGVGTARG